MKHVEAVAAIFIRDKQIAAFRRNEGQYKGYYEFAGGKVKPHESHEEALIRECEEELQLDISVDYCFKQINYDYDHFKLTLSLYVCHAPHYDFKLTVHDDVKWVDYHNIDDLNWLPADLLILDDLKLNFLI